MLLFLALCFASAVHGQQFQLIHAYEDLGVTETGEYEDVTCLNALQPNEINVVYVGTSFGTPAPHGVIAYTDVEGNLIQTLEVTGASPAQVLLGRAIATLANDDVVAAFYNATLDATIVSRVTPGGVLVWSTSIGDFFPQDIDAAEVGYAGNEGIWIIGNNTTNPDRLAVVGLDAFGGIVFDNAYNLSTMGFSFTETQGEGIDYNPNNNQLHLVGTGTISGPGNQGLIYMRLDLAGNSTLARVYRIDDVAISLKGKALAKHYRRNDYGVAFEYNDGTNFRQVGMAQIRANGVYTWFNWYESPMAPFDADLYTVSGVSETDQTLFLVSGSYDDGSTETAMTMTIDPSGGGAMVSDYEDFSAFTHIDSYFEGLQWNPLNGEVYIGGRYFSNTPLFPLTAAVDAFYAVGAQSQGITNCVTQGQINSFALDPEIRELTVSTGSLGNITTTAPLTLVEGRQDNECPFSSKTAPVTAAVEEAASEDKLAVVYAADGSIYAELTGEISSSGSLELVDLQGRVLTRYPVRVGKITLDTQGLSAGVYLLRYDLPELGRGVEKVFLR
ncbi:MAG: hypothetical protein AAGN35_20660 [Bacteroidota bacterium]